jgi:hypothetical protein
MTEEMKQNKQRYLDLISSIKVEGADIQGLIKWLEKSDFFVSPSTTKYHGSYAGGLCSHSLKVYDNLVKLAETFATIPDQKWEVDEEGKQIPESVHVVYRPIYTEDTLKIVALMHDIGKANLFTTYMRNVKNEDTGKWEQKEEYKVRDASDRFIYGSHEQNSEFMAHAFFPLSVEESSAILHHLGGIGSDTAQNLIPVIYTKYSLSLLLHMADLVACYIDEKVF